MSATARFVASRWTVPMQTTVVVCSLIFVVGTAVQAFVIIDLESMQEMMRLAGGSEADARSQAPGFLLGFRIVGCLYLVGNAVGLLARRGYTWVFWVAILVNVTQAAGVVAIPPEVFEVTKDRFGTPGLLPSLVTDGGALLLALILLVSVAVYRTPWARERTQVTQ